MASLRQRGNQYEARVTWRVDGRKKEKTILLDTILKSVAEIRKLEVNKNEALIKHGIDVSFPWQNENGKVEIIQYNLESAKLDWKESLILNRIKSGTIEIYLTAIDNLIRVCGRTCPVSDVHYKDIEKMKQKSSHLSYTTINMRLRAIKTFFNWLCDNDKVIKPPKIKQLSIGASLPRYYTEEEFTLILCEVDDELLRRLYRFYIETGCRKCEPFDSKLNSIGLVVPSGRTKNSYERTITLNKEQIATVKDIRKWINYKVENKLATKKNATTYIWRVWSLACNKVGLDKSKVHYLRHTFAVMEWLRSGDIYLVSKKLGHSSVTTTEIYTKLELCQLREDFPSLTRKLDGGGQFLVGSHSIRYNYGKA